MDFEHARVGALVTNESHVYKIMTRSGDSAMIRLVGSFFCRKTPSLQRTTTLYEMYKGGAVAAACSLYACSKHDILSLPE